MRRTCVPHLLPLGVSQERLQICHRRRQRGGKREERHPRVYRLWRPERGGGGVPRPRGSLPRRHLLRDADAHAVHARAPRVSLPPPRWMRYVVDEAAPRRLVHARHQSLPVSNARHPLVQVVVVVSVRLEPFVVAVD